MCQGNFELTGPDRMRWVPTAPLPSDEQVGRLADLLRRHTVCLLTGAGFSTESGIPDYRGEGTLRRARNPIQLRQFLTDERGRQHYWARSMLGWPRFRAAEPNGAHVGARQLELAGVVTGIVTQNVDRLHLRAGSKTAVELHGALEEVVCLNCGALDHRDDLQARLVAANPGFLAEVAQLAPDGDVDLLESETGRRALDQFRVPSCRQCLGIVKPNVVFFGEGVPRATLDAAFAHYERADALLVAGSSLAVYSGFRLVRRARQDKRPIFVVNVGATRADEVAQLKVTGTVGDVLTRLAELIVPSATVSRAPSSPRPPPGPRHGT
jgi:NAD-dependent SIR2 family protein deacetylase